jgi:hypothetical protein
MEGRGGAGASASQYQIDQITSDVGAVKAQVCQMSRKLNRIEIVPDQASGRPYLRVRPAEATSC